MTGPTGKDARKLDEAARKIQKKWMSIPRFYEISLDCNLYYFGTYSGYGLREFIKQEEEKRIWKRRAEYEGEQYELAANKIRFWWHCFPECGDCRIKNVILGGWRQLCWSCYDSRYGPFET